MSEWLKEHAWKACVGETLPRVRIPLSPPTNLFYRDEFAVSVVPVATMLPRLARMAGDSSRRIAPPTFLRARWGVIAAADFFTTDVWTWRASSRTTPCSGSISRPAACRLSARPRIRGSCSCASQSARPRTLDTNATRVAGISVGARDPAASRRPPATHRSPPPSARRRSTPDRRRPSPRSRRGAR